jgi:hypothetical protein
VAVAAPGRGALAFVIFVATIPLPTTRLGEWKRTGPCRCRQPACHRIVQVPMSRNRTLRALLACVLGLTSAAAAIGPPAPDYSHADAWAYLIGSAPNARYDEPGLTASQIDHGVLRFQASVFNACGRIYAPHYRQAASQNRTR